MLVMAAQFFVVVTYSVVHLIKTMEHPLKLEIVSACQNQER